MALTIGDDSISSDRTAHTARLVPGEAHWWEVSWLPSRLVSHETAVTAMVPADAIGPDDMHRGHRLWVHVEGWADELGLTAPDVLTRTSSPPAWAKTGKNALSADPEAAG
jgi:hypothetical protein